MRGDERDLPIPAPPQPPAPQALRAKWTPDLKAAVPSGHRVPQPARSWESPGKWGAAGLHEHSSGVWGQARWRRSAFPPYHLLRDTGVSGACWLLRAALHTSFLLCVVWGTPDPVPLSHTCPHLNSGSLAFLGPWTIKCWGQFLPLQLLLRLTNLPGGRTTGLGAGCFWSLGT